MKQDLMIGLVESSGKLRKALYKMISRNMRKCDDELVLYINCQAKQSAMDRLDL
jgi:hypothetical protein